MIQNFEFRTASSIYGLELLIFAVIYIFFGEFKKSFGENYYEKFVKINE